MFFSMRRLPLCDGKNTYARAKWMTEHLQTHVLKLTSEAIGLSAGIAACAIPLLSVLTVTLPLLSALVIAAWSSLRKSRLALRTTGDSESTPAVVAKVTGTPGIPPPDPFVTWMRIGTLLRPSATTAVDPDVVERARCRALLLFAGA